MVHQQSVGGPIQRAMGTRLKGEMGHAGEAIWAKIVSGELVGQKSMPSWSIRPGPPVDVIDHRHHIGYQVKVVTDPNKRIKFSGDYGFVSFRGKTRIIGPEHEKLSAIEAWLTAKGLKGWLIVMLLDEGANRAVVYSKPCVCAVKVTEMTPIGVIDGKTGTWETLNDVPTSEMPPGLPRRASVATFPEIPPYLRTSTKEEMAAFGPFRRAAPNVHVHAHRRRQR